MNLDGFREKARGAASIEQISDVLARHGYKKISDVNPQEYSTIIFELENLTMEKPVDGFHTLDSKEEKGFWIVHTLGENFSTPLKYHTLKAAKEQAQARLKSCPSRTVYVFKSSCIIKARIEADEVRLA